MKYNLAIMHNMVQTKTPKTKKDGFLLRKNVF